MANTLTIPVTFTDGTDALAADVNSDFNAVATFLNSTKLNDDNIKAGGISSPSLASASVTGAKLDTTAADAATLEVASGSMRIKDGGVTQAKLAARATGSTVAAGGVAISSTCGSFTTTSSTPVNINNLSVTITTTGRPVFVALIPDGANSMAFQDNGTGFLGFSRGGAAIGSLQWTNPTGLPAGQCFTVDLVTAGTYTYTATLATAGSSSSMNYAKLLAFEL